MIENGCLITAYKIGDDKEIYPVKWDAEEGLLIPQIYKEGYYTAAYYLKINKDIIKQMIKDCKEE
jgi:hypothetical protein